MIQSEKLLFWGLGDVRISFFYSNILLLSSLYFLEFDHLVILIRPTLDLSLSLKFSIFQDSHNQDNPNPLQMERIYRIMLYAFKDGKLSNRLCNRYNFPRH